MLRDCWDYIRYKMQDNVSKRRFYLQKTAVAAAAVLWLITAVRVFCLPQSGFEGQGVISAFGSTSYSEVYADISAYGKYGTVELTDTSRQIILEKAAERIGISRYNIEMEQHDNVETISLLQSGENGDVICRFVTIQQENVQYEQYIYIGITLNNTIDAAFTYEKIISEIMEEMQVDTEVNVNFRGKLRGAFTDEEKEKLAQNMLDKMKAKVSVSRHIDDVYTVYAYDKEIKDYIMIGKDKVNVNICINYDEDNNETVVYLATPMNIQDY